ncbi:hypothetical protein Nmel_008349, partial [Mimus melanotis]
MYWGNHVRVLFTVTLVWQAVHLEKGPEIEERKEVSVRSLNATVQKQQPKNEGTSINVLSDMNQSYENRKLSSRSFVPFTGITESKKLNRRCCQNGGTCILGTFCACQKHFSGRYCEYDERYCGSIPHGIWVLKGCWLCRCGYGTLHCLSELSRSNCDQKSETAEIIRLYSNGLRLQKTVFSVTCLLIILLEF